MSTDTMYFNSSRLLPVSSKNKGGSLPKKLDKKHLEAQKKQKVRQETLDVSLPQVQTLPNGQKPDFGNSVSRKHPQRLNNSKHPKSNSRSPKKNKQVQHIVEQVDASTLTKDLKNLLLHPEAAEAAVERSAETAVTPKEPLPYSRGLPTPRSQPITSPSSSSTGVASPGVMLSTPLASPQTVKPIQQQQQPQQQIYSPNYMLSNTHPLQGPGYAGVSPAQVAFSNPNYQQTQMPVSFAQPPQSVPGGFQQGPKMMPAFPYGNYPSGTMPPPLLPPQYPILQPANIVSPAYYQQQILNSAQQSMPAQQQPLSAPQSQQIPSVTIQQGTQETITTQPQKNAKKKKPKSKKGSHIDHHGHVESNFAGASFATDLPNLQSLPKPSFA